MILPSSERPSGRKEEWVMAEKKIAPKAPEKAEKQSSKTAAVRVSKQTMKKKRAGR
jgi:hypothetical protein